MKKNDDCPLPTAHSLLALLTTLSLLTALAVPTHATDITLGDHKFTLPDGFTIEQVAGPPLVNRPICADFDEQGRLYVADSSGSNENVQTQLEQKPHRIVRLEDTDGDGTFDESVVFAASMMFPEGAMWFDGSLYVSAPPVIWKLTDTDGDGEADKHEEWLDAKTLTGCANDLHGPYLGPDGWIYWCKGAFAEQTYERPGREPFVTRASHIFRRRPEGGPIEPVMTGGMDNPVEVVFTPGGERIFSTTFLVHPQAGQRDGLIHAIYGGVYGKEHGVLEGHPRTGELMPVLSHLGPAAPCGLLHLESDQLGDDYRGNLLCCLFNMHRLTRHVLTPEGATFKSEHSDFLVSDNIDFHPTDVLEDADGSLLVVNTGGWYKLCCPTSNLHKPDILGAIYRIKRTGSHDVEDPRGQQIAWESQSTDELAALLSDTRSAVRQRAKQVLAEHGMDAVRSLTRVLKESSSPDHRRHAIWTLSWIDVPDTRGRSGARGWVRFALRDRDESVRQAALHVISVWRDADAASDVAELLQSASPHNRRAAAEALGRIGSKDSIERLLQTTARLDDPLHDHSLTYALIELGDVELLQEVWTQTLSLEARRRVMVALDQIGEGHLTVDQVIPYLVFDQTYRIDRSTPHPVKMHLHDTAWQIAERHPEWAPKLVEPFRRILSGEFPPSRLKIGPVREIAQWLAAFANDNGIQKLMAEKLIEGRFGYTEHAIILAMRDSQLKALPDSWQFAIAKVLPKGFERMQDLIVSAIAAAPETRLRDDLAEKLKSFATDDQVSAERRLQAFLALPEAVRQEHLGELLDFIAESITTDQPLPVRGLALDVLSSTPLPNESLTVIARAIPQTGPIELSRLIDLFKSSPDETLGLQLVASLDECEATTSLSVEKLRDVLSGYPETVQQQAEALYVRIEQENRDKYQQLEAVLALMGQGDIRRGQKVFHGTKVACNGCHTMGYKGGRVGPDLTRIGRIRSERDLLESILFPSASFVRSYEPTTLLLTDGRVLNGVIKDEDSAQVMLQVDAQKLLPIPVVAIEERLESKVSIMPAGLDKQLTPQQLADLVTFLKAAQ
ncbi:MAG: HEAT repeat domain-containing protein [Planctomycetaceae bacterium]|nr:HEAT repeat domain-containing protein [Planctomycetaceae bacterium]